MKKKRVCAFILVLIMLVGCGTRSGFTDKNGSTSYGKDEMSDQQAAEKQTEENIFEELDISAGVIATDDLSEYVNNEVLVGYADGSFKIHTFDNKDALAAGLEELSQDEKVILIQPNYAYGNKAVATDDTLAAQQWALSNDGSFEMEDQENRFPVYDRPFDSPTAPGQWKRPDGFGQPGGRGGRMQARSFIPAASTRAVTAEAGIDINIEEAWELYNGGKREVVVALVDTGVDYSHEDLKKAIWVNEDEIANNGKDDDGNGYIDDVYGWNFYDNSNRVYTGSSDDSHGTHGAGTIAASIDNDTGIAGIVNSSDVKIMPLKALGGSSGSGSTMSVIRAIQYAEANGASICNLSLGSTTDDRALYYAMANSSMLFVVAAGNEESDNDTTPSYPASYKLDNIISVANLNYNGELHYSSNYGKKSVDLAAPGSYILSTTPDDGYSYMTGTSMAAPMVTGAAAMIYSHYDEITLADVKEILLSSVKKLDSLSESVLTGGMLDIGAAMYRGTDGLSGDGWDQTDYGGGGSAPEIAAEIGTQQGREVLVVRITDEDDDLYVTAYASGEVSAERFAGGMAGKAFSVDEDGKAVFLIGNTGTYTFYAVDIDGNETVKVIEVESSGDVRKSPENSGGQQGFVPPNISGGGFGQEQQPGLPEKGQLQSGGMEIPGGDMWKNRPSTMPNNRKGR